MLTLIPPQVGQLTDAPTQLYWQGTDIEALLQRPKVAIVGSRKPTTYGLQTTFKFAKELAAEGVVIISGLAMGIDGEAHRGALAAGGATIAVLPTPLDRVAPAIHRSLACTIVENGGALVSEYADGAPVFKYNFVERNRIMAALADVVLINEAAAKSGSIHTAQFAIEISRPTFAIPGNINSALSAGTNNLLKSQRAAPATSIDDILEALGFATTKKARRTPRGDSPAEQVVLDLLSAGVYDGQTLLGQSKLPVSHFNQTLTMLEITGKVRALGGNQWSLG